MIDPHRKSNPVHELTSPLRHVRGRRRIYRGQEWRDEQVIEDGENKIVLSLERFDRVFEKK